MEFNYNTSFGSRLLSVDPVELLARPSVIALIVANLVPLLGAICFGWQIQVMLLLYWIENVIVGIFNVRRMIMAQGPVDPNMNAELNGRPYEPAMKGSLIGFFIMHYGIFTGIHGVFVITMFGLENVSLLAVLIGTISLFLSHYVSHRMNFIGGGEYKKVSAPVLFMQPYKRVIVLHITIIFGAFVAEMLGLQMGAVIILILLKTVIDIFAHALEHTKFSQYKSSVVFMDDESLKKADA